MGFDLVNGQLIHNSDATTIQEIFHMFLSGIGMQRMADILNERNPDGKRWGRTSITAILKNERYVGDILLQKRYTTDTLPFKEKYNNGVKRKVYIQNNHIGRIEREDFEKCQRLLMSEVKTIAKQLHTFLHIGYSVPLAISITDTYIVAANLTGCVPAL